MTPKVQSRTSITDFSRKKRRGHCKNFYTSCQTDGRTDGDLRRRYVIENVSLWCGCPVFLEHLRTRSDDVRVARIIFIMT